MTEEIKEEVVTEEKEVTEEKPKKKDTKNKLKEENVQLKEQIAELKNDLLRNRADLENFKKHTREESIKDRKYASMNLVTDLIMPLEYLTKACEYQTTNNEMNSFLIGFKMIANQLTDVLISDGLKLIDTNVGDEFDPAIHHAMATEKVDGVEPGKVVGIISKGYYYKDRIIKPVMVKVSE